MGMNGVQQFSCFDILLQKPRPMGGVIHFQNFYQSHFSTLKHALIPDSKPDTLNTITNGHDTFFSLRQMGNIILNQAISRY